MKPPWIGVFRLSDLPSKVAVSYVSNPGRSGLGNLQSIRSEQDSSAGWGPICEGRG